MVQKLKLCVLDWYLENPKTVEESLADRDNKIGQDRGLSKAWEIEAYVTNIWIETGLTYGTLIYIFIFHFGEK